MPRLAPMFPGTRWPLLVQFGSRISSMRAPAVMRHNGALKLVGRFFRLGVRSTERERLSPLVTVQKKLGDLGETNTPPILSVHAHGGKVSCVSFCPLAPQCVIDEKAYRQPPAASGAFSVNFDITLLIFWHVCSWRLAPPVAFSANFLVVG